MNSIFVLASVFCIFVGVSCRNADERPASSDVLIQPAPSAGASQVPPDTWCEGAGTIDRSLPNRAVPLEEDWDPRSIEAVERCRPFDLDECLRNFVARDGTCSMPAEREREGEIAVLDRQLTRTREETSQAGRIRRFTIRMVGEDGRITVSGRHQLLDPDLGVLQDNPLRDPEEFRRELLKLGPWNGIGTVVFRRFGSLRGPSAERPLPGHAERETLTWEHPDLTSCDKFCVAWGGAQYTCLQKDYGPAAMLIPVEDSRDGRSGENHWLTWTLDTKSVVTKTFGNRLTVGLRGFFAWDSLNGGNPMCGDVDQIYRATVNELVGKPFTMSIIRWIDPLSINF